MVQLTQLFHQTVICVYRTRERREAEAEEEEEEGEETAFSTDRETLQESKTSVTEWKIIDPNQEAICHSIIQLKDETVFFRQDESHRVHSIQIHSSVLGEVHVRYPVIPIDT